LKGGKKDLVKLEGKYLSDKEAEAIALIAPEATINIIKNGEVVEKKKVKVPEVVVGIVKCPNPTCISRKEDEPIKSKFRVVSREPLRLQCAYCETEVSEEELSKYVVG